jgi:YD repeat-containing protein
MTSTTDALGRQDNIRYDGDGNKIAETWVNADRSIANVFTFTYDPDNNLLSAANNVGTITLAYNDDDQLTSQTDPWGVRPTIGNRSESLTAPLSLAARMT